MTQSMEQFIKDGDICLVTSGTLLILNKKKLNREEKQHRDRFGVSVRPILR